MSTRPKKGLQLFPTKSVRISRDCLANLDIDPSPCFNLPAQVREELQLGKILVNPTKLLSVVILSVAMSGHVFAAGGPMNEDLTSLAVPAQNAIDAGKAGNAAVFQTEAETALTEAKGKTDSAA